MPSPPVDLSKRAVVTREREIRLYIYHDSDRMSVALTRRQAIALAHDLLVKALEGGKEIL
jgi:hypothetical protein